MPTTTQPRRAPAAASASARPLKSWHDKLHRGDVAKLKVCPRNIAGMRAGEMMLIPTALQFDEYIRTVPAGQSLTVPELRAALAKAAGADVTCPVTSGFHLRVVAEVAAEQLALGIPAKDITPVWRVLDDTTATLAKLGDRAKPLTAQRRAEGL